MQNVPAQSSIFNTFELTVFGLKLQPSYLHAMAFILLIFMSLMSVARFRHLYVKWSTSGWHAWMFLGFIFALLIEGFLIIGGRTVMTELLGWKNPPKPVATVLDAGRNKAIQVMGVTDEVPSAYASGKISVEDVVELYNLLDDDQKEQFRLQIVP